MGPVYFSHIEATSVVLEWRSPRDDGGAPVTSYRIEVSQTQDTWTEVTVVEGDVTKIKAKDLTTDKKHYFRVFATNKAGTSKPLVSDAVTPQRAVGTCGCGRVCVWWGVCVCVCACFDLLMTQVVLWVCLSLCLSVCLAVCLSVCF